MAQFALAAGQVAALGKTREGQWQPGLAEQPLHNEIFADCDHAGGAGLALALARDALESLRAKGDPLTDADDQRQVLWVQDARAIKRGGRPYRHGLPPDLRHRLIHVAAKTPEDALFALEEGVRCRDLACVIGEISGNPRALDFTASRRLSLAAQKHGVGLWLVRLEAQPDLSSARMRWQMQPAPSPAPLWNDRAPGPPAWEGELFRANGHAPGKWILSDEQGRLHASRPGRFAKHKEAANTQNTGDMVHPTFGRSLAAWARA